MAIRANDDGFLVHLRHWGLTVEEHAAWRTRGRPYNFTPRGVLCHHTASAATSGNFGSESTVVNGRPDLPGPLCNVLLGRDGTVKTIAMGDANHAGEGGPLKGIPKDEGNYFLWGIEAENNGTGEAWPEKQMDAYAKLCAALLDWIGSSDENMVIGHKEWAPGRKTDPDFDMNAFRKRVKDAIKAGPNVAEINVSNLSLHKKNKDVLRVKQALKKKGYKGFVMNQTFGRGLKRAYAKFQKSLGYSGKDANGIPGEVSLTKLGFEIKK